MRVTNPDGAVFGKSKLESLLILQYMCVRESPTPSFKVKVSTTDTYEALRLVEKQDVLWTSGVILL